MLRTIAKILIEDYGSPVFTIHDCIYTIEPSVDQAKELMLREFKKSTGIVPHLKMESNCQIPKPLQTQDIFSCGNVLVPSVL